MSTALVDMFFNSDQMKSILTIIILMSLLFSNIYAQKHDYNWILGYFQASDMENYNGMLLDFNEDQVAATIFEKEQWFSLTNLAYSDASGSLQLYSDGCAFYDENGILLANGTDIHEDDTFCDSDFMTGYPANQGMIVIPTSEASIVSLFYNEEYFNNENLFSVKLQRAMIDLENNIVLSKQQTYMDTISGNILSATKHSNGEDWWIINQDYYTNEYKCLLISEGEVIDTVSTFIGNAILAQDSPQSNFSPDGTMFARFNPADELQLYDFDRSTGKLCNFRYIDVPTGEDAVNAGGLAFSGSSRYLYVNDAVGIWQYDTQAADIAGSVVQVAEREVFSTGFEVFGNHVFTFFYKMALAPDCRIYMSSRSGVDRIYVIMEPEQKGIACNVVQNIRIPVFNAGTTPHYPNYRLDKAPFCDSSKAFPDNLMTTVSTPETATPISRIHVFPNPARDQCKLYLKHVNARQVKFQLTDLLGRPMRTQDIEVNNGEVITNIDISDVPTGIYFYTVYSKGEILLTDRLIIEK